MLTALSVAGTVHPGLWGELGSRLLSITVLGACVSAEGGSLQSGPELSVLAMLLTAVLPGLPSLRSIESLTLL